MAALLQELVTAQAAAHPERIAVVAAPSGQDGADAGTARLTYGELEARSNQIARQLRAIGLERGDRVALFMRKSPWAIAALVGIYKADCVYVPLDPASPATRLIKMLESCEARAVLAGGVEPRIIDALLAGTPGGHRITVGWLDPAAGPVSMPSFTIADVGRQARAPREYANGTGD